uniref:Pyridoxamine 5'-phosphate oxidase n=1 Tax=Candidatus Aschnera chinzeii TaxID=1485666 RepID=A0AAT9G4G4_9ENTR|nr:MAG: pyridoxamine 5'-phosphate oxidase [Candidatus Aschnera chinzeii]
MIKKYMDISLLRREYISNKLKRTDLTDEPLDLFERWLNDAYKAKLTDPTAMCMATVDELGQPYQRIVLLKSYDTSGLVFYTNVISSRKSRHIIMNNKVSLLFPWYALERQVCFLGKAIQLTVYDTQEYFKNRPRNSQITSSISEQSTIINNRNFLIKKFFKFKRQWENNEIPLPRFWGGYRVIFNSVEFWQGRANRLHDRFLYEKKFNHWHISRLAP